MNENQNNGIRKNTDISDRYAVVGGTANLFVRIKRHMFI